MGELVVTPIPTVHLNGTSGERLLSELAAAVAAVHKAIDAVCEAAPNARDYYPQGPAAWPAADDAHAERVRSLMKVREELGEIHLGVYEQLEERKRIRGR